MAVAYLTAIYSDGSPPAVQVPVNPRRTLSLQKGTQLDVDVIVMTPSGVLVDLTTVDPLVWSMRKNPEPLNAQAIISRGCFIPAGAGRGRARFSIVPADTVNLPAGRYVWDFKGKFPGGKWETLIGLSPLHLEASAGMPDAAFTMITP